MPGILRVVLEELVLKIVRWKLRGMLFRNCISENSQTQWTFQCWKVNFMTEVCVSTSTLELTTSWINDAEMTGSFDDVMTSQLNAGESFLDFEMLDARIASASRKIISSTSFRGRVGVEEQRAQQYDRFLRGKQIAYMIYGHFQSTGVVVQLKVCRI